MTILHRRAVLTVLAGAIGFATFPSFAAAGVGRVPRAWRREWPDTVFSKASVKLSDIKESGLGKDDIPAIDVAYFVEARTLRDQTDWLADTEPVISVEHKGDARAYPVSVLMWHEIVNDSVGGMPMTITYCPLCNAAMVFDRRLGDRTLDFGTTGKLRHSDMVMYDRQTESWWQQFVGEAIVGELTGARLTPWPARIESFARFIERFPKGSVLIPEDPKLRAYGANAYRKYDTGRRPTLYDGRYQGVVPPLARVVAVGDMAWSLKLIREQGRIETAGYVISWTAGQNSALDTTLIREGRDIGNITVQRLGPDGVLEDVPYQVPFAFAFKAFYPQGNIISDPGQ